MADGKISIEFETKRAKEAANALDLVKNKAREAETSIEAAEKADYVRWEAAQKKLAQYEKIGLFSKGGIEIRGAEKLALSSESFAASINAAAIVLSTASGSLQESSNVLLSAAGKIAGLAGQGWGIGSMFGGKGGIYGATFATAYGIGSIAADYLYGRDPESIAKKQKELERQRAADKAKRQARYDELKFDEVLGKADTVEEAKSLVQSLQSELGEIRMKIASGTSEFKAQADALAATGKIESKLKKAEERLSQLQFDADWEKEGKRRTIVSSLEFDAVNARATAKAEHEFEQASTGEKIAILRDRLAQAKETAKKEYAALTTKGISDTSFEFHRVRYTEANNSILESEKGLMRYSLALEAEQKESAKKERERIEKERGKLADQHNDAFGNYSATGTSLQRAGVNFGGTSSTAIRIAQVTAENIKSIMEMFRNGEAKVSVKGSTPLITD